MGRTVEPDESPKDAARRKAEEEANVVVRLTRLVTVLGGPLPDHLSERGRGCRVPIVYEAEVE